MTFVVFRREATRRCSGSRVHSIFTRVHPISLTALRESPRPTSYSLLEGASQIWKVGEELGEWVVLIQYTIVIYFLFRAVLIGIEVSFHLVLKAGLLLGSSPQPRLL